MGREGRRELRGELELNREQMIELKRTLEIAADDGEDEETAEVIDVIYDVVSDIYNDYTEDEDEEDDDYRYPKATMYLRYAVRCGEISGGILFFEAAYFAGFGVSRRIRGTGA
jgi:hypothetical protein